MSTTNRISQIRLEGPKSKSTRSSWPSNKQQSESLNCKITKKRNTQIFTDLRPMWMSEIDNEETEIKKSKTGYPSDIFFYCFFLFFKFGGVSRLFFCHWFGSKLKTRERGLKNDKQWDPPTTPFVSRENTHVIWIVGLVTSLDLAANTLTVSYSSFWP